MFYEDAGVQPGQVSFPSTLFCSLVNISEQLTQYRGRGVQALLVLGSFCRCNDFMLISIIITSQKPARAPTRPTNTRQRESIFAHIVYLAKCSHDCVWVDDSLLEVMTGAVWVIQIQMETVCMKWLPFLLRVLCRQSWDTFPGASDDGNGSIHLF